MNRSAICSSLYFGWSGHKAAAIYNRWRAQGQVPALPHKGALSAGIRPFTISGVWPWASGVLVLPGMANYDGVRILAIQKVGHTPHLVLGTVETPIQGPYHNVDDLRVMGESVAKSLHDMNYRVIGSTHWIKKNAGGDRKFDVWRLWHLHEDKKRTYTCQLRRKGETPLSVMGRGHPAYAGRYAVETSLSTLEGVGLNNARKYVIMQAVRRDWIAPWRKWLQSWASPDALRVANVLGSMGFLSDTLSPFGALLLRLMHGMESSRRIDFALRYPLYTPIWLPAGAPVRIDDAIAAGQTDDALRLIHDWMYGNAQAAPIKRMKRVGARWPLIMRFGHGKDGSNNLTFGRYKELMDYGLRIDRPPEKRKEWLLLHKVTGKLDIHRSGSVPSSALNRSLRQVDADADVLAVDKTETLNMINTAAKAVEMVLGGYLMDAKEAEMARDGRLSGMSTVLDLNDASVYNIFKSHCRDAVVRAVVPAIDLRKMGRIEDRWHGQTEMARFEALLWLIDNGAYPILPSAGISRRMERLSEVLWLKTSGNSMAGIPSSLSPVEQIEQCVFKPLLSLKSMAEDTMAKGHCMTPEMMASFMGIGVPAVDHEQLRVTICERTFVWSIGQCTVVMHPSGVVEQHHVPDSSHPSNTEREIKEWIDESTYRLARRLNLDQDSDSGSKGADLASEYALTDVPEDSASDLQGIQFLLMEACKVHLHALWRRAGKLLPPLRGPCSKWVHAHMEPIIRNAHRDAAKYRQMFDR